MGSGASSASKKDLTAPAPVKKSDTQRRITVDGYMEKHVVHARMTMTKGASLGKDEVKALYPDTPSDVFDAVYDLFDWEETADGGTANISMFSLMLISLMVSDVMLRSLRTTLPTTSHLSVL